MFGHDESEQTAQNGNTPVAAQDSASGAAANMDVTTAGADSGISGGFSSSGYGATEPATASDPGVTLPAPAEPAVASAAVPAGVATDDADSLLTIKQQALQQLSPLVGHLDQTPEEKFRTTMMMIQASDNQELIKDAYAAAQAIEDEKTRAQALLDIINEINYFTQQHQS